MAAIASLLIAAQLFLIVAEPVKPNIDPVIITSGEVSITVKGDSKVTFKPVQTPAGARIRIEYGDTVLEAPRFALRQGDFVTKMEATKDGKMHLEGERVSSPSPKLPIADPKK